jgi:hypothetical protein
MPLVKNVEKKIRSIEGFQVVIRGTDGHDVKGNRKGMPQYGYERAAKDDMTVENWRRKRFHRAYPGFRVDVITADGRPAVGNTKLSTIRQSYSG